MRNQQPENLVDLANARLKLESRKGKAPDSLNYELEEINLLLDKGLSVEARARLNNLISAARNDPVVLAGARLALSCAFEMHGDYPMSLQTIAMYEADDATGRVPHDLALKLKVQISTAYNYCGDHPRAIALLQAAVRDLPDEKSGAVIYAALARVYRSITESAIARDHSRRALELYREAGDWRGLAEAYFGIGLADHQEGNNESTLKNLQQALQLIGDHPATFLLGKIYSNMAGACWHLKRPREGIEYLEKAIDYYEHSDHQMMAAVAYNNLGGNLTLVGQWDRAADALNRAVYLITQIDGNDDRLSMPFDSLGELYLMRGDLDVAHEYLQRAVALSHKDRNKWYECQALRTMARCQLAMGQSERALATAQEVLDLAQNIRDSQSAWDASLLVAESYLVAGKLDETARHLAEPSYHSSDSLTALVLNGEQQRLHGLLELARDNTAAAVQHFGRCLSIFELLGDKYRVGRSHFDLGSTYGMTQPELATEHLTRAVNIFRELGAKLDLQRAAAALEEHEQTEPQQQRRREAAMQLITLRLADAVASRPLLLRELAAIIRQESTAKRVIILEADEEQKQKVVVAHGCEAEQALTIANEFSFTSDETAQRRFVKRHDVKVITLNSANSLPATLLISPQDSAELSGGLSLDPLLRVAELGMDVCALRARATTGESAEPQDGGVGASLMPGFIHSSPAMTRLVEEVHKIRSSDVTVLVTGESGSGKELVARAIHALSSRRDKIFVPFNCTAVPKELSESYLFGHTRGAFTGAVSESVGVIRSAAGGTLFIDEIGDLPLDVQPKLLRFLQEGEIQPLGEQQPINIDVRVIAATNTALEELVAQGCFREDLYYRLNVIRLRVPPLRERRSEIPTIVNYYINHYSSRFSRQDIQITPQAVDLLMVAEWPGNVRQLCNEIQRMVARAENGALITPEHLSPELRQMAVPTASPASISILGKPISGRVEIATPQNLTLAEALEEVERRMIIEALRKHRGNISRAARELGLTRRGLYLKLDRYQLSTESRADGATA